MKTWILIATVALAPLSASAQYPQGGAVDEKVRAALLADIEAHRTGFLPQTVPPAQVTVRYQPRLNDLKAAAAAAKTMAEIQKAQKEFADWKTVLLAELYRPSLAAASGGAPAPLSDFSVKRFDEQASLVRSWSAKTSAPDANWSGVFDNSTAFGGKSLFSPTPAAPAPAAVRAPAPPAANDPARYAKIRALLLSKGVSPKIVDTAIAEGIRQKVDPMIVLSVINQESNFKKNAYNSGSGCTGLMQMDHATAADMGVHGSLYDPSANIKAGTKYLNWIANSFFKMGQDLSDMAKVPADKLKIVLASYNWGIGNVSRSLRKHGAAALDRVAPKETRDYIAEVPSRIYDWFASF